MMRRLFPKRHESSEESPMSSRQAPWDVHNAGFRAKECAYFVPLPRQKAGTDIQGLRCHCGERLYKHADFREPGADREEVIENLVPQRLQELCAADQWDRMVPEILPDVSELWSPDNFRTTLTNACGKMTFSSARSIKPAKYIRVSDDDDVQRVWMFLKEKWKIMNPKPDLVISIVGGAKNYRLDDHKDVFENGLLKIAETTQPLLITSGFNVGVMKAVGQIMKQGQSYNIRDKKITHSIRCLGIAPWGFVKNRFDIEKLSYTSQYNMTAWSMDDFQPVPLNPHHTHFVLVDNGFRNRFTDCGNISKYRADLEVKMNLESPVVLVVVEGGLSVLSDIKHSLSGGIPVVICNGTGRAADLVSYAFARSDESGGMSEEYEEKIRKYLMKLYGNTWRDPEEKKNQVTKLRSILLECLTMKKLITIFEVNQREGLDFHVLKALFKGARNWGRDRRLDLAISLNRPDFAEKELFGENAFWEVDALLSTLETCILRGMDGFVRVILQEENMDIHQFLTPGRLQLLYTKASVEDGLLVSLLDRHTINLRRGEETDGREIHLLEIGRVLDDLLDQYDKDVYKKTDPTLQTSIRDPCLQLFIWAVLNEKQTMAVVFWEYVEAPVATALLGSWLYFRMSHRLGAKDQQWSNQLLEAKKKMELLAVESLKEMRARYPKQAADYVAKDTPLWGHSSPTCLQMAAAAEAKMFLSSPTCQAMFKKEWEGEVKMGLLRIFLCLPLAVFLPFLVHVWGSFSWRFNHRDWRSKVAEFLWSPRVKFMCYIISYLVFLLMFSYMVLFDVQKDVSVLEWACGVFVLSILMDELHRLISIPALSTKSRFMLWRGRLYLLFVLSLVGGLFALVYHVATGSPKTPKYVYSVVCVLFYLRILRFYTASKHLGPKLHIIKKTLRPLGMFGLITLVFLLAYGVPAQALMYQKRSFHWGVFWDLLLVPYWQIYGELQLDDFGDDVACLDKLSSANRTDPDTMLSCRQHSRLVPVLFAVYLLFANVLLINLIIAIFTKIFETVERSSILIWKYQMYFFIKEYGVKSILPAPFSLVEDVFRIGRHITRLCCRRGPKPPALDCDEKQHLRWVERQVIDRFLRKSKQVEALSADKSLQGIHKSIGALQSILLGDIGLFTNRRSKEAGRPAEASGNPTPILTRRERLQQLIHNRYSHARAKQVASTEFLPMPKRDMDDRNSDKDEVDGASSSYSDSESEFLPQA